MQLLLFRHGIAEAQGPDGADESRRLTEEGVSKTQEAARGLARLCDGPQLILTSPLARAQQTAGILAEHLDAKLQTWNLLAQAQPRAILDGVAKHDGPAIILVGHEPTLSAIILMLCGSQNGQAVRMKKAGCALLELPSARRDPPRGELLWLATPRMLRLLGGAES